MVLQNYPVFAPALFEVVSLVGCQEQPVQKAVPLSTQAPAAERSDSTREQLRQHLIQQTKLYQERAAAIASGKRTDTRFAIDAIDKQQSSRHYANLAEFRRYLHHLRDSLRATGSLDMQDTLTHSQPQASKRTYFHVSSDSAQ